MYIVWDKARFTVILSALLVSSTAALAIANVVGFAGVPNHGQANVHNSEVLPTFGGNTIGIAAACMSLVSNTTATVLVAVKAWYNSTHIMTVESR